MNQFLLGLVERATLRAPVLERRPRSLFEPVAPAGPAALDGAEQAEPDDLDGGMEPAWRDDAPSDTGRASAAGGDPDVRSPRIESSSGAGAGQPPDRSSAPASRPARADDEPRLGTPPSRTARHAAGEPRPLSAAPSWHGDLEPAARLDAVLAVTPRVEHRRRSHGPPASTSAPAPPAPHRDRHDDVTPRMRRSRPATGDPAAMAPLPDTSGGPPARANLPPLHTAPRVPGPPALLVRSQAGPRALRSNGIAAPMAPVHVTIGRIEVRASTPAGDRPAARRSPAGPKLTLDEYLNDRRGRVR